MIREWLPLFRLRPHYLVAISCAIALSSTPNTYYILILIAFSYFVSAHGELANFVYDYASDKKNPRMQKYAHITGKIKISSVKKASYLFLFMALFAGGALLNIKPALLPLILLGIHGLYSYSIPPLRLKRYWWGGVATYTTYSAVVLLISAVVLGAQMETAAIVALAFWLGSLSVWTLTSIPDQEYDKKEGIETQAIKFGAASCISAYLPLVLLSTVIATYAVIKSTGNPYAAAPFLIPTTIGVTAYFRMKKEVEIGMSKQAFNMAILPYRYNMALVTLSFFTTLRT